MGETRLAMGLEGVEVWAQIRAEEAEPSGWDEATKVKAVDKKGRARFRFKAVGAGADVGGEGALTLIVRASTNFGVGGATNLIGLQQR